MVSVTREFRVFQPFAPESTIQGWECVYDAELGKYVVMRFDMEMSCVILPTCPNPEDQGKERAERLCKALNRVYFSGRTGDAG